MCGGVGCLGGDEGAGVQPAHYKVFEELMMGGVVEVPADDHLRCMSVIVHDVFDVIDEGRKCSIMLTVVPKSFCRHVCQAYHESEFGVHVDFARVYERMLRKYYWPEMYEDIKELCRVLLHLPAQAHCPLVLCLVPWLCVAVGGSEKTATQPGGGVQS